MALNRMLLHPSQQHFHILLATYRFIMNYHIQYNRVVVYLLNQTIIL